MEEKKAAVFLDQTKARFIHLKNGFATFAGVIESDYEPHPRYGGEGSNQARFGRNPYQGSNNEFRKHRQEREEQKTYFRRLSEELQAFDDILLFGPGETKKELFNHLGNEYSFRQKSIHVQNSDYLSDNQLLEMVRDFYLFSH